MLLVIVFVFQPWNDFMNRSGEEQEKLLSLLEEEARKKSTDRILKDHRNGESPTVTTSQVVPVLISWMFTNDSLVCPQ